MREDEGSITGFFQALRAGDGRAAEGLFVRYFPRLLAVAERTRRGGVPAAGPEDAAQSAFVSFWRQAEQGGFAEVCGRNELWALLSKITARKALKQARHEAAAKRGGAARKNEADLAGAGDPLRLDELAEARPAAELDLCCEELLLPLDEEQRTIALLRLAGHTNREIAQRLGCTERKIERKLNLIRLKWGTAQDS